MAEPEPEAHGRRLVTVVGCGVHAITLVESLAARDDLAELELVLHGRRSDRLDAVVEHLRHRLSSVRPDWWIRAETNLAAAVAGADAVIVAVRVGGSAARSHDEQFPAAFGLAGDEGLGLGGMANAWRTMPFLQGLASTIQTAAPGAFVLNMTAPLGLTTRYLRERGLNAVGVCELPMVLAARLAELCGPGFIDRLGLGGLNHLSWFWAHGDDDNATLRAAALHARLVDEPTWKRFHGVPMPYWYRVVDVPAGEALGVRQPAGRASHLAELAERAILDITAEPGCDVPALAARPTPWFDQAVAPVLAAWFGGRPYLGTLNVRNGRLWPALGRDTVVEVRAQVMRRSVRASPVGDAPAAIERTVARTADIDDQVYRAAVERDWGAMSEAAASHAGLFGLRVGDELRAALIRAITDDVLVAP